MNITPVRRADLVICNSIGPGFSLSTSRGDKGLGGSELEIVQIAHALARRGHKVIVCNGVDKEIEEEGVTYLPLDQASGLIARSLWIERSTATQPVRAERVVIRATDINWTAYDHHMPVLRTGAAALCVNTRWQAQGFAGVKEMAIIPPALDFDLGGPPPSRVPGSFVYVSAPMKGLKQTLEMWRAMMTSRHHPPLTLTVVVPGFSDMYGDKPPELLDGDDKLGIRFLGMPSLIEWRRLVASAEGLFFVNGMNETYGCAGVFAEHFGTRHHILCLHGHLAGFGESLKTKSCVATNEEDFKRQFWEHLGRAPEYFLHSENAPDALAPAWEEVLQLTPKQAAATAPPKGSDAKRPEITYDARAMDILETFKLRLIALGTDPTVTSTATPYWMTRAKTLAQLAKTMDPRDFLRWTNDLDHVENESFYLFYDLLRAHPEWSRWQKLTRIEGWGNPHEFSRDLGTAPVPMQHAYTLMAYERATGCKLTDDIDVVVEFGGGYGNFARMLRADGFRGRHIIIDLPHTREFQDAFLRLSGVPVYRGGLDYPDAVNLCVESYIPQILELAHGKRVAFVAMWSLSEAPLELRAKLFPALHASCTKYLIQSQWPHHVMEPEISNADYFTAFMKESGKKFSDRWIDVDPGFLWPARNLFAPSPTEVHDSDDEVESRTGGRMVKDIPDEDRLAQEELPENKRAMPAGFGSYLGLLRGALSVGGSEFGLGLTLMSLVASTRASRVVEIGRYRGFSTLAIAMGLALADEGWREPTLAKQRPDVDYDTLLAKKKRTVVSIERYPRKESDALIEEAGLSEYVEKIDQDSAEVDLAQLGVVDILLIDGHHGLAQVRGDVARYVPHVRPGGYFVLHDYFGWYDGKENGSRAKRVIDEDLQGFERILIDTGFASFVIFRKTQDLAPQPARVPARKDGRPTVGLVLIAHGDEAATIIARAIVSAFKQVDAVTVVADGGDKTVDVCRALGADVYLRKTPAFDWETGVGAIAGARNDAIAIAERKTDFVLMLDPDDYYEGEIPKTLNEDIYEIYVHDGGLTYPRPQLFRSNMGFRYVGIVHEHIAIRQGCTIGRITSLKYVRGHGGQQDKQTPAVKFGKHARWLEKWLIDHPEDTRSQFYLAQSYRDAGMHEQAIAAYERRITMNGWDEERAFAATQIARIFRDTGRDPTAAYLRAFEMRPTRAEGLTELATWLRDDKQKRFSLAALVARMAASLPLPADDKLFLQPSVYEWRALEELAIASYWSGDKKESKLCYEKLLTRVPKPYVPHIEAMLFMCKRELGE